ncbi:DUF2917 domain-containing protein [Cupriavidus necator]
MRELRTFELDEPGQPVSWRAGYGQTVCAAAGKLWVTVEGDPNDIWLEPGAELALPEGYRVWLSGDGPGARFTLAQTPAPWSLRRLGAWLRVMRHRVEEHSTDAFGECPRIWALCR